jgi:hypothetical protein
LSRKTGCGSSRFRRGSVERRRRRSQPDRFRGCLSTVDLRTLCPVNLLLIIGLTSGATVKSVPCPLSPMPSPLRQNQPLIHRHIAQFVRAAVGQV